MLIHASHTESTLYDALAAARTARRNSQSEAPIILSYEMAHHVLNIIIHKDKFGLLSEIASVTALSTRDLPDLSQP